ncbi:MAG: M20/M25/M40 family metallo-hydrolase [Sandaracinaceae bacterium]|nr:M20/M25/M40 family metallo-hydrolase [Sandaracinaceae bacterium]
MRHGAARAHRQERALERSAPRRERARRDVRGHARALRAARRARARAARGADPPSTTINLGRIEGGDNPNRICARCELDYDVRVVPGVDFAEVRGAIHERVARALAGKGVSIAHLSLTRHVPPFETPAGAPLVRALEELTGHAAVGVSFGTEAPFLAELGMSTVVLGPGDIAVAHQPDEHLPLDRIEPMLRALRGAIERVCVRGQA